MVLLTLSGRMYPYGERLTELFSFYLFLYETYLFQPNFLTLMLFSDNHIKIKTTILMLPFTISHIDTLNRMGFIPRPFQIFEKSK